MQINEITCRSALVRTGLPGGKYALNPYRGCQHACTYCYAPSVLREKRQWGSFLDVKTNIADVLETEVAKMAKGNVLIGTVTDAYQPMDVKYKITRRCLEVFVAHEWPITIQTKSALVTRDADLLYQMSKKDVGFTVTSLDPVVQKKFEPGGATPAARLAALKELAKDGIQTWIFIGPVIPGITENEIDGIVAAAAEAGAKLVMWDRLRARPGFGMKAEYASDIGARIRAACEKHGIACQSAFPTDSLKN
jgi:DNA repair photolyase